ncbi:MAG TPA: TIGR02300 family protein [Roseiarcus sp.]
MAKPELGTKHQCQNCGAKFFDLNKDPIVCPKCGTVFQGVAAARARPAAKAEEEEDTEIATPAGVDVVSLDEVEAGEEKAAAEPAVDDIDAEEDAEDDSADDPFLEEEEEDDDDVSNLIDGDIAPDEET